MNILNRIKEYWVGLGASRKITIGVASAGAIAMVVALLTWANKPRMELLYGGLSDEDMAKVLSVVQASGVKYTASESGNGISVSRDKVYKLRMTLATQGIPSDSYVGLELFGNNPGKLGVSDFEQRINKSRAIQGELERAISSLDGVKRAKVLIVEPETRLIKTNPNEKPKASVIIDTGSQTIEDNAVNGIRHLVANAVEGVNIKDVSVVDNHGNTLSAKFINDGILGEASGSARFLRQLENDYSRKVESMLEPIYGAGKVVARVAIELEMDSVTIVDQNYDPEDTGTLIKKQMIDQDSLLTQDRALGDKGIGANPNLPGGGSAPGTVDDLPISKTEEDRESQTTDYIVDSVITETVRKPGGTKYISASVIVGTVNALGQPLQNNLEELKETVANALGLKKTPAGAGYSNGNISMIEREFPKAVMPSTFNDKLDGWLQGYSTLINSIIGVMVAIAVLITFFKIMKRFRSQDQPEIEIIDDTLNNEDAAALLESVQSGGEGTELAAALTPDLLNELIQERGDNVSSALRSWVNAK
jgi:flagellar M-ring protein FliF